jgi:hypothetical protein
VIANIRLNKRLAGFNGRGREKVNTQWDLYCMVHNIQKLAKSGYACRRQDSPGGTTASAMTQICGTLGEWQ